MEKLEASFYVARAAVAVGTIGLWSIDMVNSTGGKQARNLMEQHFGDMANHVGDIVHGLNAMSFGFVLGSVLEAAGVNRKVSRVSGLLTIAGLFAFVHWAEFNGFANQSDLFDVPAIWLGLLGAACLLELANPRARNFLRLHD